MSEAGRPEQPDKFTLSASDAVLTQCVYCRHWFPGSTACEAFPGSIPAEILANDFDHSRPWIDPQTGEAGDQGVPLAGPILFEPRPGTDPGVLHRLRKFLNRP